MMRNTQGQMDSEEEEQRHALDEEDLEEEEQHKRMDRPLPW